MPATEAQIRSARENGSKSRGPVSPEGKANSMRNSFKHGMSGNGIVLPKSDLAAIEDRIDAYEADMRPRSPAGQDLIRRLATLAYQMDLTTRHQFAATAMKVRHAGPDFDEARLDAADDLFGALGEAPRNNLRRLRKSPEGIDRLVEGWTDLRADLTCNPKPIWTAAHPELVANLVGLGVDRARTTQIGALAQAVRGDFDGLDLADFGHLKEQDRQVWAKDRLVERIDLEIADLEAHRLTLDFETIDLDRAEAGDRARFDTSKEGILARRYAAEAERNFFKALKEFRQVEAECLGRAANDPTPAPAAEPTRASGSFREPMIPLPPEFELAAKQARWAKMISDTVAGIDLIEPDEDPNSPN
jgi:hypothetical protein